MWGTLISAGVQAAGSIIGGIAARKKQKAAEKELESQRQKNQDWYDRRYNEDATQRADAQALLTKTEESIKNRNKAAAGTAAVMGGTDESVALEKEAGNKLMSDTVSNIVAANEERKDKIESQYMERDNELSEKKQELLNGQAQNAAAAGQGMGALGSSIAGLFSK